MTRRNSAEALFKLVEQDVRLRTLPAAAQMIWMKLMRLAVAAGDGGFLRFGFEAGFSFGFLVSVSLAVTHTESEVKTALETLAARDLVEILPDEAGLRLPHAAASADRIKAAQNNGFRGGRPRKGETSQQAYARRQGEMLMPIPGGGAESQETQAKPNSESSRAVTTTHSLEEVSSGSTAREETELVSLGAELAGIARLESPLNGQALLPVQAWRDGGASCELIRQVVRTVAQRSGYDPAKILTFGYFAAAVEDALAKAGSARGERAGGKAALSPPVFATAAGQPVVSPALELDAEGLNATDRKWRARWEAKRQTGEDTEYLEAQFSSVAPRLLAWIREQAEHRAAA